MALRITKCREESPAHLGLLRHVPSRSILTTFDVFGLDQFGQFPRIQTQKILRSRGAVQVKG